ncbi:MAG: hypothetical protein IPG43_23725 [Proteobacteria bacterium]|nr:hypothetical protein [Pseudomonadota bacterium]
MSSAPSPLAATPTRKSALRPQGVRALLSVSVVALTALAAMARGSSPGTPAGSVAPAWRASHSAMVASTTGKGTAWRPQARSTG